MIGLQCNIVIFIWKMRKQIISVLNNYYDFPEQCFFFNTILCKNFLIYHIKEQSQKIGKFKYTHFHLSKLRCEDLCFIFFSFFVMSLFQLFVFLCLLKFCVAYHNYSLRILYEGMRIQRGPQASYPTIHLISVFSIQIIICNIIIDIFMSMKTVGH